MSFVFVAVRMECCVEGGFVCLQYVYVVYVWLCGCVCVCVCVGSVVSVALARITRSPLKRCKMQALVLF
jgi:hypothetical protein